MQCQVIRAKGKRVEVGVSDLLVDFVSPEIAYCNIPYTFGIDYTCKAS